MNTPETLKTRREFLRTTVLGGALTWTVPVFLENTFAALQAGAADRATQITTGRDASILVVVQVAGGNDGLNTVVPIADDDYYKARPTLAIAPRTALRLTPAVGLHPSLTGFRSLFTSGHLAIIQGVGYPNPNRSHFRSTDIWATASDADRFINRGWLGRYFDNACAGADPTVGIAVNRQRPLSFAGKSGKGINVDNPDNFKFATTEQADAMDMTATQQSFRELNQPKAGLRPEEPEAGPVDYVKRVALDAQISSEQIIARSKLVPNRAIYPRTALGNSLKLVARWIGGGMPTRVYYVSQGGYDTHINQAPQHARLLQDLGDSIKAFVDDLKAQRHFGRVMLMTFSEFGRRVKENASAGTDHGAASVQFIVAPKVRDKGLFGSPPSLAPGDLTNGDPKFTMDFRSVYAGVLEGWLQTPSAPILGRQFESLVVT